MSAWLVTDTHISALTQAAVQYQIIHPDQRLELAQRMKQNNLLALHHRYRDDAPPDDFTEIEIDLTTVEAPLRPDVLVDGFRCWDYQCMEYDGYNERIEYKLMGQLVAKLHEQHVIHKSDRWGIDSWDQVIDTREMGVQLALTDGPE